MAQCMRQSSLVGNLEQDIEIKAPARKFYNILAGRPQDVPKATPENIQGCDINEGKSDKVGSILSWNFVIDGQPRVIKERIEALEPGKNFISCKVIDGDFMKDFKNFFISLQATPKQGGPGSVVKFVLKYERINEKVAHPENLLAVLAKATKKHRCNAFIPCLEDSSNIYMWIDVLKISE